MTNFVQTAEARNTSVELMQAILKVANGHEEIAEFIWEMGASDAELDQIIEIVTQSGRFKTTDFHWGVSRTEWANP
ncbi:hypothetical protein PbB2_02823 [Candidatus Phycosocius bacilliformis]|uniref:Uncharacterized protein n=1 Tax=Candidatus Phycosocius bacilliformis TaxID=1445552 RepID=A0A2P2EDL2_9PROT|nr:YccJ family protein [Candidatus Phycosocius bacilliformis]GBF59131.1 hypothetical protein PbB2_02823 [Candidatus Phycosocius bacilliformis]